jgi:hypothetical protein
MKDCQLCTENKHFISWKDPMQDRVQRLKTWIETEARKQTWVARQVKRSPQWLSYVLKGKEPMSDKLARALQETLGIPLLAESHTLRRHTSREQTNAKVKGDVKV